MAGNDLKKERQAGSLITKSANTIPFLYEKENVTMRAFFYLTDSLNTVP